MRCVFGIIFSYIGNDATRQYGANRRTFLRMKGRLQHDEAGSRVAGLGPARPRLSRSGLFRGARDVTGAIVAVTAFGLGFGAAAIEADLSPAVAVAMSAFVFAGAAQFAALELWESPIPMAALAVLTLTVNARHVVLGATLRSYLSPYPPLRRYASVTLLTDANWAVTQKAYRAGERDLGHLVGGGLLLWTAWVVGTGLGAFFGSAMGDLSRFGIDVVMPAFFACMLIDLVRSPKHVPPLMLAAVLSAGVSFLAEVHWAVLLGAFAGGAFGAAFNADGH